jgi:hypothetical protein
VDEAAESTYIVLTLLCNDTGRVNEATLKVGDELLWYDEIMRLLETCIPL